ncbi:MAG: DUF4382 domain-containing protein [Chitinophagaceae bacterium]
MKISKKSMVWAGMLVLAVSLFIASCQKSVTPANNTNSAKKLSVYLTDDPCQYDSVFIDIRYVEVKIDTSTQHMDDDRYGDNDNDADDDHKHQDQYGKWDTLTIRPGVYNILRLRNGIDTLLATGNLPAGKIRKIRLTLGTNNSLTKAGVSYPLNLLPGTNNYVYLKIHKEDEDEVATAQSAIWIDFNICESIRLIGGQYYLKPFLKAFSMQQFGKIEGKVFPHDALPFVKVFNGTDSASAMPENDGEYKIRGLRNGVYSIKFTGSNGYRDTTISNIQVQKGIETHIVNITLRK